MTPEKFKKLEQVFRVVFELPSTAEVARVSQASQANWDSLRHVTLVTAVENEFGVSIDTADALRLDSFETTLQLLEERGV
jgi:acyl carrier protein